MRDLTVSLDGDFAPARRPKARSSKDGERLREPAAKRWRMARATIFKGVVWGGFVLLMGGIVLNAAFNQKGHHPAPILGTPEAAASLPSASRRATQVVAAMPAPAPVPAPAPDAGEPQVTGSVAPADGIAATLSGAAPAAKPKPAVHAAARTRPGMPHATTAKAAPATHVAKADRNRLTSLFATASKAH